MKKKELVARLKRLIVLAENIQATGFDIDYLKGVGAEITDELDGVDIQKPMPIWHDWDGYDPDAVPPFGDVRVRYRNGNVSVRHPARMARWKNHDPSTDIIAWRDA